ncbi:putative baseplate assembly protein [Nitriliruptor alkaliphilus]|uniref:putative baseplate assembly protein n=1 Tax=Nitriliruptor alkaliphilus TaxID=427918 RepID=UPI000698A58F|nr:putative baseplate assembly protein [Nitriliruptor alkaliphilus]
MSLPVPNLDDRRFQDLVDEAKRMIPSLTPEWTNHNVADPGVALIELFAWMSEQVIYRLNQVPDRLYVDFLNLLGTSPFSAAPARVPLTFWLSAPTEQPVVIPAGTEVTTAGGGTIVFSTVDTLRIQQPTVTGALTSTSETAYTDVLPQLHYDRDTVTCFSSEPVAPGDAFNLGFDVPLAGQVVELTIQTAERGIGVDPTRVPITWEVWSGEHWLATEVIKDTTGGLNQGGAVRMVVPDGHRPLLLGGQRLHWLRVRLLEAEEGQPTFRSSPKLTNLTAVSLGGTVAAEHARTVLGEVLGSSDGTPGQRFALTHRPVLPRREAEEVVVTVDGAPQTYTEVADFGASGPADRHVVFDESAGSIEFGPRVRYPDGTSVQHGAVPPFGAQVTLPTYRTGGGAAGNIAAERLTALRTAIAYVDRVTNLHPARGGVDAETVDEVKVRGPRTLRTGQRAVTPSDFEQLTLEASPQVARARCVVPDTPLDPVHVLVVPTSDRDPRALELDDFALTPELFATVRQHLDARRTLGSLVRVSAPYYQGVSVVVRLRATEGRSANAVRERVDAAIARFLSPLEGGPRRDGWSFGVDLHAAVLISLIEEVPGVAVVDELALFEYDLRNGQRLGDMVAAITLDPGALFLVGANQVVVR